MGHLTMPFILLSFLLPKAKAMRRLGRPRLSCPGLQLSTLLTELISLSVKLPEKEQETEVTSSILMKNPGVILMGACMSCLLQSRPDMHDMFR